MGKSARIGGNVKIGAYATIGDNAKIADGCVVESFAQVLGFTELGANSHIFSYAVIGSAPQDLKYRGERSYLVIGKNNILREFVTIHPGTQKDSRTFVGDDNLFMAYAHVGHDCAIGSGNIFANNATLAGHVDVGDKVVIGGLSAAHQFCRLGDCSIVGGCSKVVQDIPPYSLCDGHPASVRGLNSVGLRRAGFSSTVISELKKAFKILFFEDHAAGKARELVKEKVAPLAEVQKLLDFVSSSRRGISR